MNLFYVNIKNKNAADRQYGKVPLGLCNVWHVEKANSRIQRRVKGKKSTVTTFIPYGSLSLENELFEMIQLQMYVTSLLLNYLTTGSDT